MECGYCGLEFEEAESRHHCEACLVSAGCRFVRCPRCGYENPEETGLVRWIRSWRNRRREAREASRLP